MVRIVLDSASDLPPSLQFEHNISVVSARVRIGDQVYRHGVDLTDNEFYRLLPTLKYFPKTVPAPPRDFYHVFTQSDEPVLYISTSRKLSNFFYSAHEAKNRFNLSHVTILDSESLSMCIGMMGITASKMARMGYTVDEITSALGKMIERARIFLYVPTLRYLFMSGRVNQAQFIGGSLLNTKPILGVEHGVVESVDKAFGARRAMEKLIPNMGRAFTQSEPIDVAVVHSNNDQGAQDVKVKVLDKFNVVDIYETRIGTSVGANIGPGGVGITIVPHIKF